MYLLTAFSPSMFKAPANLNITPIEFDQAQAMIDPKTTTLITNRISAGAMVKRLFGTLVRPSRRFLTFKPGDQAVVVHYRGPTLSDDGMIPPDGLITFYSLAVE